ncbi:MAG TPA: cytochrome c oxidase assembly protein [Candidatus Baltobacteraceae bacterium]|nr:cytochrome c oxidase assembly protein [Candidatus Baltobacteraceae bacterium]
MSESALEIATSLGSGIVALGAYCYGVARYRRLRKRAWPVMRTVWFVLGVALGIGALAPQLDAASDVRFAPHMLQHLILIDLTAPLILLGAPLLLVLSVAPNYVARRIVAFLQGPAGHVLTFPVFTWSVFVLSVWLLHFTGFFEASLAHEPLHVLEHAIFLITALLFWFPLITIGPTPWSRGPLAHPVRMLYLLIAMPAGALLGFSLYGARHVLYPHYAAAGLADQQTAGEIMWIGGSIVLFVAFMLVGFDWARHEERLGERLDAR